MADHKFTVELHSPVIVGYNIVKLRASLTTGPLSAVVSLMDADALANHSSTTDIRA